MCILQMTMSLWMNTIYVTKININHYSSALGIKLAITIKHSFLDIFGI